MVPYRTTLYEANPRRDHEGRYFSERSGGTGSCERDDGRTPISTGRREEGRREEESAAVRKTDVKLIERS
jgi:hypothetical protein